MTSGRTHPPAANTAGAKSGGCPLWESIVSFLEWGYANGDSFALVTLGS